MTEPAGSERTERLEQELAQAREQRDRLASSSAVRTPRIPISGTGETRPSSWKSSTTSPG